MDSKTAFLSILEGIGQATGVIFLKEPQTFSRLAPSGSPAQVLEKSTSDSMANALMSVHPFFSLFILSSIKHEIFVITHCMCVHAPFHTL